ncbi:MAG: hypothetical protein V4525_09110 [Pseudomonadota bacterium]
MSYLYIKRTVETNAPLDMFAELGNDWTHFIHVHRKSHAAFQLLFKKDKREIFFYKSYLFYPLPIYKSFIVFREYVPEQNAYRQIYMETGSGRVHYSNNYNISSGSNSLGIAEFWFSTSKFWTLFPKLFFYLFSRRMRIVAHEDNMVMKERLESGVINQPACAPKVDESFDFYIEKTANGFPIPLYRWEDHYFEDIMTGHPQVISGSK